MTGAGTYVFIQEFGSEPDFKEKCGKYLSDLKIRNFEIFPDFFSGNKTNLDAFNNDLEEWQKVFEQYNLRLPSVYFNINFTGNIISSNQKQVMAMLSGLKKLFPETDFLTVNPEPLDWDNPLVQKSDEELEHQLREYRLLVELAKSINIKIAYHFHVPELVEEGREMCYMLDNTTNFGKYSGITFDPNWCVMADHPVSDVIDRYEDRILALHLRSSHEKSWDEILLDGEEQNKEIVKYFKNNGFKGIYYIELANNPGIQPQISLRTRLKDSFSTLNGWLSE
jgi:sugar phosphate isomerase/epimerase